MILLLFFSFLFNIFWSFSKSLVKKISGPKKLGQKFVWVKKIGSENCFGLGKILGPKKIWLEILWVNKFWSEIFLGQKKCGSKKIWVKKNWAEFFFA